MTELPTLAEALQEAKATIDGNPLHLTRHLQVLVLRVEELEAENLLLPEWRCPACGAVTRAQMADAAPDALKARVDLLTTMLRAMARRASHLRAMPAPDKAWDKVRLDVAREQRDALKVRVKELEDRELQLREQAGEMAEELERLRRTSIVDHAYVGQEIKVEFDEGEG